MRILNWPLTERQKHEFEALGVNPEHDLVFTTQAGTKFTQRDIQRHFERIINNHDLRKITVHGLRDTYISIMLEEGEHVKAIAERVGLTSPTVLLDRYAHVTPKIKTRLAEKSDGYLYEYDPSKIEETAKPAKEELEELINSYSFTDIGNMYGVSDNAIRKWCKSYGLPYRKKDIKSAQ